MTSEHSESMIARLLLARERRLHELARLEASPKGFVRFRPIEQGPLVNALLIGVLGLVAPFYLAWRALLRMLS